MEKQVIEIRQFAQLGRNRARQRIAVEIQPGEIRQVAQLRRNLAGQPIVAERQDFEIRKVAQFGRNRVTPTLQCPKSCSFNNFDKYTHELCITLDMQT